MQKIRSLNKPPFHTTLAANDRICFQILFSHHGTLTSEFVRATLCPLDAIAVKILEIAQSSAFQRKCLLLNSTPKDRKTFDHAFVPPYKVCTMSLDVLKESQIDELTKILQKLKVFHYVLPCKSIFIFGHGTCMEALRIKCAEKNITIPIGRKQGSLQVTFEGLESEPRNDSNGFLIRESIGEISREMVQIFNCPGLLDENGKANSEVVDYLVDNFAADNFSRQYVRCEDSHAAAVLAFDIPTRLADKIPVSFVIGNHAPFVIHFLAPLMKPERFVSVVHPAEDKTDAFMNSFKDPEKRHSKVSSVAPIPSNQSSWARFQAVAPHLFVNNHEVSIPCSTLDESFPFVFIASPISADEFEAISSYFAEEPRYFQHHSWIPALLTLPVDKCLHKSDAGPGVYHIRMRSWHPANINQPRQEAGRIVVGRSNAFRLLVYEHADLVVFVPAGGALLDLFDDPHSIGILRHKAIPKEDVSFDFTTRPDAVTSRSPLVPTQWTQNDYFHATRSEHVEEEVIEYIEYIPTALDEEDDTTDTPVMGDSDQPHSLTTAANGNLTNTVGVYHTEGNPASQQPQNNDIKMNQGHSSDDKLMPSTIQFLLQADSSQISDSGKGQDCVKPSGASNTGKSVSCTRGNRGKSVGERLDNEAEPASAVKPIVPLASSTNKDSNMPSTTKEAMQEAPSKTTQLVLQRIVEVKDFIAKDASLNAMSFTPTDIERAATFLLHLPDVSCFYVAATRLLSKAGWRKEHQLQDDDLQSFVLKEVAKGWTLAKGRYNSKFTRFHLALVLGAYSSLNPLCIDSVADAILNIVAHMISSYHSVFCAEVGHKCPTCSKSHKWFTPFFESTLESYDGIDEEMLPRIFLQCVPESESFPRGDACCVSSYCPQVIQEASIKLVNLQFHGCELPNVSKYPVILSADPFVIDATTWIACSVVVHTLPNHFYILERLDRGSNAYNPSFFKHDNASGLQKGCVRVKAEDRIVAILFRKTDVKPLWPNARCTKKPPGGPQNNANPGSCLTSNKNARSTKTSLDSAKSTKQAKKRAIPVGKFTSHTLQLSPLLNKKRRRFSSLKPDENSKGNQTASIFSQAIQSAVGIPVPDSDEELAHEQVQSILHQHLQNTDDPISQFSSPESNKNLLISTVVISLLVQLQKANTISHLMPTVHRQLKGSHWALLFLRLVTMPRKELPYYHRKELLLKGSHRALFLLKWSILQRMMQRAVQSISLVS